MEDYKIAYTYKQNYEMQEGETLSQILRKTELNDNEIQEIIKLTKEKIDLKKLNIGTKIETLSSMQNDDLFIHDDLWTSFFLFYVKKVKILSHQSHLKKDQAGKFSLIYKKHSHEEGLISSYGKNINDAVRKRDEIALKSLEYMFDKINSIKF